MKTAAIYIVMGVSGSGKTTVAKELAEATGADFLDADDFHTPEKKAQMHAGIPLTDEDRWPWLDLLNGKLRAAATEGRSLFLACSSLRQIYRDLLTAGLPQARVVYLKGSFEVIHARLAVRKNHFMPASLLESQFATLEEPQHAIVLDITHTPEQMLADFLRQAS